MLHKGEIALIELLSTHHGPMTAAALASGLGVSVRTVKNYVKRVNQQREGTITSSHKGYEIDVASADELFAREAAAASTYIPQTNEERATHILRTLLQAQGPIDIFDLCEELFVSYSTMKGVIPLIRGRLSYFHLDLRQKRGGLYVEGRERDKRRALSHLLYDEADESFFDARAIQRAFPSIDISFIEQTVRRVLDEQRYFVNAYSMPNLVLHIVITIDRIRRGPEGLAREDEPEDLDLELGAAFNERELAMGEAIARALGERYGVVFDIAEVRELALLLASRTTMLDYRDATWDNIEQFVGRSVLDVVDLLIEDLRESAGIDLYEQEFYVRFALHIKNLIARAHYGGLAKNPLTEQIRRTCPLLYDTAVVEADLLQKTCGIHVNDDEIAYIAFHLGTSLVTQRQLTNKVKAVLYCPEYYDMNQRILLFLNRHFEDDLLVTCVVDDEEGISHILNAELLISVAPVKGYHKTPIYVISVVPSDTDAARLRQVIERIKREKRRGVLRENLEWLIKPEFFEVNTRLISRDEVIHTMSERLVAAGYVDEGFEAQVREREELSSTACGIVAIPHALRLISKECSISVTVSRVPITWGDGEVRIVVLLSFNKTYQRLFYELFDPLVSILSNREYARKLLTAHDYETFIACLCDLME